MVKICQKFVQIHETLVYPTLLKYAQESVDSGMPIIRPLWLNGQSLDNSTLSIYDEFMIGDDFLVAPVLAKSTTMRDVYLPAGTWLDAQSRVFTGPMLLKNVSAPIDAIPYFVNQAKMKLI